MPPDLIAVGCDEAVVLLSGDACHGLEPVGVMGAAHFYRPILHGVGYRGGDADVKRLAVLDGLFERLVGGVRQTRLHLLIVEYHAAEIFGYAFHKKSLLSKCSDKQRRRRKPKVRYEPSPLTTPLPFDGASIHPPVSFVKSFFEISAIFFISPAYTIIIFTVLSHYNGISATFQNKYCNFLLTILHHRIIMALQSAAEILRHSPGKEDNYGKYAHRKNTQPVRPVI